MLIWVAFVWFLFMVTVCCTWWFKNFRAGLVFGVCVILSQWCGRIITRVLSQVLWCVKDFIYVTHRNLWMLWKSIPLSSYHGDSLGEQENEKKLLGYGCFRGHSATFIRMHIGDAISSVAFKIEKSKPPAIISFDGVYCFSLSYQSPLYSEAVGIIL